VLLPLPRAGVLAGLFLVYLALAVVATWPLAPRLGEAVYGLGTPPLNVWAIGWVLHQLPREPLHLFDGNAFYPYHHSLAFSEHLFVPALQAAPFAAATGNLVLAHNAVALLTLATAGLGMFLLARELVGDDLAAFGAGLLYAFHTWNLNELIRIQILSNQWFPFLVLAVIRYFAGPSPKRALVVAAACALQTLSCMYWALYEPLLLAPLLLLLQWRWRRPWRQLLPLAIGFAAVAAVALPFAWPYLETARELGFERPPPLAVGIDRWLDVLPGNWLFEGWLGTAAANRDAAHFLGFTALLAAGWGVLRGRFRAGLGIGRGALLTLAAAGLLLSLGPEIRYGELRLAPGPYGLLYELLPPFRHVRYPERFSLFVVLGLAPLAAAGLAQLRGRLGRPGLLAAAALLFLEHLSIPLPLAELPGGDAVPAVYRWLAHRPELEVVAEVPSARYKMERHDARPMYFTTAHWKRSVQGFTGYFPPSYNFVRWRLFHFPEPESLRFCRLFGVDTLIVQPGVADAAGSLEGVASYGPFPGGHRVLRLSGVAPGPPGEPPALAPLVEVPRGGWRVQASHPGAALAVDGDPSTAWSSVQPQGKGDFYRIRFSTPRRVARVSLSVSPPFEFPLRVKLLGEHREGGWREIPFDEDAAYDRLLAALLHRPRDAWLDIEIPPATLTALRVRIRADDAFALPWTLPEIRVWAVP
jgi:hypothetical protein